jgi:hypothetical protein
MRLPKSGNKGAPSGIDLYEPLDSHRDNELDGILWNSLLPKDVCGLFRRSTAGDQAVVLIYRNVDGP